MFGIGIIEVFLILVVALIVIGPKQMPIAARKLGHAFRQAKAIINDIKAEINKAETFAEMEELNQNKNKQND